MIQVRKWITVDFLYEDTPDGNKEAIKYRRYMERIGYDFQQTDSQPIISGWKPSSDYTEKYLLCDQFLSTTKIATARRAKFRKALTLPSEDKQP